MYFVLVHVAESVPSHPVPLIVVGETRTAQTANRGAAACTWLIDAPSKSPDFDSGDHLIVRT
jgi:hypothetical protein